MPRLPDYPELGPRKAAQPQPLAATQDRAALASARARMLAADVGLRRQLADDPDHASWTARYAEGMQAARTEASTLFRSPLDRARFEHVARIDQQRGADELARSARQLRFQQNLESLHEAALYASDEATRVAAINAAGEAIAAAEASGDLSPEGAGAHRRDWVRDHAANRIELARLTDVDGANPGATKDQNKATATQKSDDPSPLAMPVIQSGWDQSGAGDGDPSTTSVEDDGTIVVEATRHKKHGLGWKIADKIGLHEIFGDGEEDSNRPPPSAEDAERAASMEQRLIDAQIGHSNRARFPKFVGASELDTNLKRLGAIISFAEGAGPEGYNGGTKGVSRVKHSEGDAPEKTVTGKTINEILATESMMGDNPDRMFVTGKYQTNYENLRRAKTSMHLTGDELYTEELQDRIFRESVIEKAGGGGLADFVKRGEGTVEDAQYAASKEWASIAVPKGKKLQNGEISDGTQSFYEQSGVNKANAAGTKALVTFLRGIESSRKPQ